MPGLVPGIHGNRPESLRRIVDGRDKPGHDGLVWVNPVVSVWALICGCAAPDNVLHVYEALVRGNIE